MEELGEKHRVSIRPRCQDIYTRRWSLKEMIKRTQSFESFDINCYNSKMSSTCLSGIARSARMHVNQWVMNLYRAKDPLPTRKTTTRILNSSSRVTPKQICHLMEDMNILVKEIDDIKFVFVGNLQMRWLIGLRKRLKYCNQKVASNE